MEDDVTVRVHRVVVKVVGIASTHVTVIWPNHRASLDLHTLTEEVRQLLRIEAEFHAHVHGDSVYNLRPIAPGTSVRSSSRTRLVVR